jgi:hypothetical protein
MGKQNTSFQWKPKGQLARSSNNVRQHFSQEALASAFNINQKSGI